MKNSASELPPFNPEAEGLILLPSKPLLGFSKHLVIIGTRNFVESESVVIGIHKPGKDEEDPEKQ